MNYGRLVAAAVIATIVDLAYGSVVYGMLLTNEFARYPGIFRPVQTQMAYMPYMMAGIFVGMLAAVWVYAKGYEGGKGIREGVRFGSAFGVFIAGYTWLVNYSMMSLGRRLAASMAAAAFAEWIIVGAAIGLAYKAAAAPKPKSAAV